MMRSVVGALLLATLGAGTAIAAPGFTDVPEGHVFETQINWLAEQGITKGCNPPVNDRFCPDDPVTRGQMAAFLVRALDLRDVDPHLDVFADSVGSVFVDDIMILATAGITKGCNPPVNDEFCPNDPVTRGQMAAFLVRALGLTGVDPGVSFVDTDDSIFATDILKLATVGITRGCNPPANDRYCPDEIITRGQMAAFLYRALAATPWILTRALPGGIVGEGYTATLDAAGGQVPYSWAATGLPDGIALEPHGVVTGTPTTPGLFLIAVELNDAVGKSATSSLTITVGLPLGIVTDSLPSGTEGAAFSFAMHASGGEPPYTWKASGLPAGLTQNPDGTLSGTPTVAGEFLATVTVTDAGSRTDTISLPLQIYEQLRIAILSFAGGTVGENYEDTLTATGGEPPYLWDGIAPPGLSVDPDGTLRGTPTLAGEYEAEITVTDGSGRVATAAFPIDIDDPLEIPFTSMADGRLYVPYDATLLATGGEPPYVWLYSGLPSGIGMYPDGTFIGTPRYGGNYDVSLTLSDADGRTAVATVDMFVGGVDRLSVSTAGVEANGASAWVSISGDGRMATFASIAKSLVPGDTDSYWDIYLFDTYARTLERISVDTDGNGPSGSSNGCVLDYDGDVVAFASGADDLIAGDANGVSDVFIRNMSTGVTTRVSVASNGAEGNDHSVTPQLSHDGRYVSFVTKASTLVEGDTNEQFDVFVHDRQTGETRRVSVASDGAQANGWSTSAAISGDGRWVAFSSDAPNLVAGDVNNDWDVFLHDLHTGETTRVSASHDGLPLDGVSDAPSLSADGRLVVFLSQATNVVPGDENGKTDVFLYDRLTGSIERLNYKYDGSEFDDSTSGPPLISADGRFVQFHTRTKDVVPGDTDLYYDAFVLDRYTGDVTRLSVGPDGTNGSGASYGSSISADGAFVVLQSESSALVPDDTNDRQDVFIAAVDLRL
ncbi:MAG: putative Ig domain-containing protein [Actinomycetota bacterium]|nr:putative Ig domain-containing protein [Actinomycetota bacterium]